jgi:Fur family transcriptional regulator, ferric uptake regulator
MLTDVSPDLHDLARSPGDGGRLTQQRRAVWRVFLENAGHMTAEELLAALQPSFPHLSTATVYRELSWLKRRGLISETDVGRGPKVYERLSDPPHHHLVCLICGSVADLDDSQFNSLRQSLQREVGFVPRIDHFAIFGACRQCRE